MSYSFVAKAGTRKEVMVLLEDKFDDVVKGQPIHSNDKFAALSAASEVLDIVPAKEGHDFQVSLSGSLSWAGDQDASNIISANVSATAYLVKQEAKPETENPH